MSAVRSENGHHDTAWRFRLLMLVILLVASIVTAPLGISSDIANSHASAAEVEQSVVATSSASSSVAASVVE